MPLLIKSNEIYNKWDIEKKVMGECNKIEKKYIKWWDKFKLYIIKKNLFNFYTLYFEIEGCTEVSSLHFIQSMCVKMRKESIKFGMFD